MMLDSISKFFKKKEESLPTQETALSFFSQMYGGGDFVRYNPDLLLGAKGPKVYETMMQDEQVKAVVKFRRDAITSRQYYFEIDHEAYGISEEEAKKRIDLFYFIVDKMPGSWKDCMNNIMSAMYNGFSMNEKVFAQVEYEKKTWWGWRAIKLKPFSTFYFKVDDYGTLISAEQRVMGRAIPLDMNKFIHFVFNPDKHLYYGESELRAVYRPYFSKDMAIKFHNIWLERHAGGFRFLTPKGDKKIQVNSDEYNKLIQVLANINVTTGAIFPSNVEYKGEYPNNNVAFGEAINMHDMMIARGLLVPNLLGISPQGQHGSLSQSDTQLESFTWTLECDTERLVEVINEQGFRQLGEMNFGDDAWPRFCLKPLIGRQLYDLVKTWKELVQGGAVTHTEADELHVRDMLNFPEPSQPIDQPEGSDNTDPNQESPPEGDEEPDADDPLADPNDDLEAAGKKKYKDQEIVGKGIIKSSKKIPGRVDFAVIAKKTDDILDAGVQRMGLVLSRILSDMILQGRAVAESVEQNLEKVVDALKVDGKLKSKLNQTITAFLRDGFNLGVKHAAVEIDKAKGEFFSKRFDKKRVDFIAEDFFKVKSFKMTGDLTTDAQKLIEAAIINGAKFGRSWDEIEDDIYATFARKGLLNREEAREALGAALDVENPDARLRTVVRTGVFEALNEARYSYFTDPALGGYVKAFEYSAILDSRTTEICRHLDEDDEGDHTVEWYDENKGYVPPNHFNCRSVLIPVTADDKDFVEGPEPTVEPQEGFD